VIRFHIIGLAALIAVAAPLSAQQEAGDREVGIGGALIHLHAGNTGNLFLQASLGYFQSKNNFFGIDVTPIVSYGGGSSFSSVVNGTYRRFFGTEGSRVFPFVGAGAGVYLNRGGGDTSSALTPKGEVGLKSYISQKTSIEFSYSLNIVAAGSGVSGGFNDRSLSVAMVSLRHLF
jgi:hypothetical protein